MFGKQILIIVFNPQQTWLL